MKQIFRDKGIIVKKEGFGEYFKNNGVDFKLTDATKSKINCSNTCGVLCDLYSLYNNKRHMVFHVDGLVETTKVLDRKEAEDIINSVLNAIESSYLKLSN